MLLTLTTTHRPATDLGFLLFKHPGKAQAFGVSGGTAHVFYPRADDEATTAALMLDLDPLAQGARTGHVTDRPYVAGSQLAVAIRAVFRTAMTGRCDARADLAATAVPLSVHLPTLPCRGPSDLVERLFGPLGWTVDARPIPLEPPWGDSHYRDTTLTGSLRVADALTHLYVLLPVLDGAKHYLVGADEIDKLLRAGAGWLPAHPEKELITQRYLAHRTAYVRSALERLADADDVDVDELDNSLDEPLVRPPSLARLRREAVVAVLRDAGARRVLDLGCGGGALLRDLLADPAFTEIVGVDVTTRALETAARRLHLDRPRVAQRLALRQSALTYVDPALAGYDAAVLMEVIEHVDEPRLPALERSVFGSARPGTVVVTTPNAEYNVRYAGLTGLRHADHRFEWPRARFREWGDVVASRHGYRVRYLPVGDDDPEVGPPTQMAVLTR